MEFTEYSEKAMKTAMYPNIGSNPNYPALGLAGETGEVCEKIKKLMRDSGGIITDELVENIKKELGDVLWYVNALCHEFKIELNDVAETNIQKLYSRKERGALQGNGDNR